MFLSLFELCLDLGPRSTLFELLTRSHPPVSPRLLRCFSSDTRGQAISKEGATLGKKDFRFKATQPTFKTMKDESGYRLKTTNRATPIQPSILSLVFLLLGGVISFSVD